MIMTAIHSKLRAALASNQASKQNANKRFLSVVGVMAVASLLLMPELAMAAPWDNVANKVLAIFTGGLARTIAIIAVIACGIMALLGKLSWDWAIKIILGIVLIFGATAFVDYMISAASGS